MKKNPRKGGWKMPTREEVLEEFYGELNRTLIKKVVKEYELSGEGEEILKEVARVLDALPEEDRFKYLAGIKIDVIKEWEGRGRKMDFLPFEDRMQNLLSLKHFGKPLN